MHTISEILDRFESEYIPKLAPRTQGDYRRHVAHLKKVFGHWNPDEMRPKDFAEFTNVARGPMQRVRQLAVLSSALTQAVSYWFWCERNVLRDVKRRKNPPRDRLISDEEFEQLKSIAPKRVQMAMMLALLTGQRQGDIIRFKWADIRDNALMLRQGKTGKRMAIVINKELERVLDQCWLLPGSGSSGGQYVLPTRTGKPYTSEGFRACWQRVHRQWLRLGKEAAHFHDIRGMAATKCGSVEEARALLGHSDISLTYRVYRRGLERVQALKLDEPPERQPQDVRPHYGR